MSKRPKKSFVSFFADSKLQSKFADFAFQTYLMINPLDEFVRTGKRQKAIEFYRCLEQNLGWLQKFAFEMRYIIKYQKLTGAAELYHSEINAQDILFNDIRVCQFSRHGGDLVVFDERMRFSLELLWEEMEKLNINASISCGHFYILPHVPYLRSELRAHQLGQAIDVRFNDNLNIDTLYRLYENVILRGGKLLFLRHLDYWHIQYWEKPFFKSRFGNEKIIRKNCYERLVQKHIKKSE